MPQKKYKPEEFVAKLRQVDVLVLQSQSVAEAVRTISVAQFTYYLSVAQRVWRPENHPGEASEGAGKGERAASEGRVGPDAGEAEPDGSRVGKLLSPTCRRRRVDHVMQKFRVSERLTCRVLGQNRSTQRKVPRGRPDEEALTADIMTCSFFQGHS